MNLVSVNRVSGLFCDRDNHELDTPGIFKNGSPNSANLLMLSLRSTMTLSKKHGCTSLLQDYRNGFKHPNRRLEACARPLNRSGKDTKKELGK